MPYNIRRPVSDSYDPKQRIVGGVVLFLIMLLIYSVLKLILGFSSVPPQGKFGLGTPLGDEIDRIESATPADDPQSATAQTAQPTRRLPQGFVFLDINGRPMQREAYQPSSETTTVAAINAEAYETPQDGKYWYVQAASFKTEDRAHRMVEQIKAKNIAATANITQKGDWYVVRLPPQDDPVAAEQQKLQLRRLLKVHGKIRKID